MAGNESDAITAPGSIPEAEAHATHKFDEILMERFEVRCPDGWRLVGELALPPEPRAVVIAGHAMMVDRRTLDRPRGKGLVSTLARRGIAVVWPDLRGHGRSGPRADRGGSWSYDDLVEHDAPTLIAFARAKFPSLPLVIVGHSLFGHVSAAYLGRHAPSAVDGLALLSCNIATRAWRASWKSWLPPLAMLGPMGLLSLAVGRMPARRLKLGNNDEALPYVLDFLRWARHLDWVARDGYVYTDGLSRITAKVAAWVGAGDRVFSPPRDVDAFVKLIDHSANARIVGKRTGLAFDPAHMDVVLDGRSAPLWHEIADFVLSI